MKNSSILSKEIIGGIVVTILFLYSLNFEMSTTVVPAINGYNGRDSSFSALIPHEPFEIISDENFTDYDFLGSGTDIDPYIIEGYEINTTSDRGISVSGTTKYFVIRDCYVDAGSRGIYIGYVAQGTASIINNTCINNYIGINLWGSSGATIINNTCIENNAYGIRIVYSPSAIIIGNTCNDGLDIFETNIEAYTTYTVVDNWINGKLFGFIVNVSSTTFSDSIYGQMLIVNCTDLNVRNQVITNASTAIKILFCDQITLTNNTSTNNNHDGIYLRDSSDITLINNTCSFNNNDGIWLHDSSGITFINNTCSFNNDNGFCLDSLGITLINNTCCNNNYRGIFLDDSPSSTLTNNTCNNNKDSGIIIADSSDITLINNTCTSNDFHGILLYYFSGGTLTNNTCTSNNFDGIWLWNIDGGTLTNNTCNNNNDSGIYLTDSDATLINNTCNNNNDGIFLAGSGNSTVSNNTCNNNNDSGIYLGGAYYCLITYNLLQENEDYGIKIASYSEGNSIHHNTFIDNNLGGTSQAIDNGTNNIWYDLNTNEGNYWSDWLGTGNYSIAGDAGSVDPYPLDEPAEYTIGEYQILPTLILLISFVPLLLTWIISRKRMKKPNIS